MKSYFLNYDTKIQTGEVLKVKQVGMIFSYSNYEEYIKHREDMHNDGYICMDWIPRNMDVSYLQFIRYRNSNKTV